MTSKCIARRAPRVPVALPIQVSIFSSGTIKRASLRDLTPHSIAVETQIDPSHEDDIEVSIQVPYEISLEKHVTVRFRGQLVRLLRDTDGDHEGFAALLHPISSAVN